MATNQEIFESKLDDLADSINAKAGTSGKKTLDEMIETVDNIALPTITVEDIEGGHRVTITDHTGTRSFDVMDGTPGESAPSYILNWYAEPTEAQKQANLSVMNTIRTLNPGEYMLFITKSNYTFPALYITSASNGSFIGLSLQDGVSLAAYQFKGTSLANYQQLSWSYIEQTMFDASSSNAGSMNIIAAYIEGEIATAEQSIGATISSHTTNDNIHVTSQNKSDWNAKYDKPSGGIPASDLSSDVDLVPDASSATDGQLLTADGSGGYGWEDAPVSLPSGGATGQVLTKQSNADGDVDWDNIPTVAPIVGELTLLASAWVEDLVESEVYKQEVTIASSNTNSKVDIIPSSTVIDQMLSDGVKSLYIENDAGTLYAVAVGAEPSAAMTIQYQMVIVVSAETIGAVDLNDVYQTTGDILILDGGTSTSNTSSLYQDANGQSF